MNAGSGEFDLVIVGAGPVGLLCAHLAHLCGLRAIAFDRSPGPLTVGRADALNARTLQLLEIAGLFDAIYPLGKPCDTSSVWANGGFVSRESAWWDELQGCFHPHFLMLGQSHVERILDDRLREAGTEVRRRSGVVDVRIDGDGCVTELESGDRIRSRFVIGADGARSFVRTRFDVGFEITRPRIVWAVIDGIVETDFPKVPEIIVFQAETSDVAWIPREGNLDRFYVRMDSKAFEVGQALEKINRALSPHTLRFREIVWSSSFSVKESVAERFSVRDRVFLAGDAGHVHSVNGGQGLNTGLADAFNLVWKLHHAVRFGAGPDLLRTYEAERKPVARSVVETSGELVRATSDPRSSAHAREYVEIVRKRAGNITGMGVRYGTDGIPGSRLLDLEIRSVAGKRRLYSLLDYSRYTLLLFGDEGEVPRCPSYVQVIRVSPRRCARGFWMEDSPYAGLAVRVRPDSYIESAVPLPELGFDRPDPQGGGDR